MITAAEIDRLIQETSSNVWHHIVCKSIDKTRGRVVMKCSCGWRESRMTHREADKVRNIHLYEATQ